MGKPIGVINRYDPPGDFIGWVEGEKNAKGQTKWVIFFTASREIMLFEGGDPRGRKIDKEEFTDRLCDLMEQITPIEVVERFLATVWDE